MQLVLFSFPSAVLFGELPSCISIRHACGQDVGYTRFLQNCVLHKSDSLQKVCFSLPSLCFVSFFFKVVLIIVNKIALKT